jgi:hypothetical protein
MQLVREGDISYLRYILPLFPIFPTVNCLPCPARPHDPPAAGELRFSFESLRRAAASPVPSSLVRRRDWFCTLR